MTFLVLAKVVWFPGLVTQEMVGELNIQYCHSGLLQEAKTCLSFITFCPDIFFRCHVYKVLEVVKKILSNNILKMHLC